LQVYKGVLSPGEFNAMTDELTSGPCIAFEVADRDGADSVEQVRLIAGRQEVVLRQGGKLWRIAAQVAAPV